MHPQPGHATRFEKSPGGVTRAHGVAHSRMVHQLARAEYPSKRWLWPIMALATVVVPVVVVLSGSESLSGENLRYLLYGLAFVVVLGVGLFAVFGLGGTGAGLIIPEQLVPPHVVSGLFMHFSAA